MRRKIFMGAIGMAAVTVSAVSVAWACEPGTSMTFSQPAPSIAPGESITATFTGFPQQYSVEVRLDNPDTGPIIGQRAPRATDGPFTEPLTIPANTTAGCHIAIAYITDPAHKVHSLAPASIRVVTAANPNPDCTQPPPDPGTNPPTTPPPAGSGITAPVSAIVPPSGGKTINGTSGSDNLTGTPFADVINCGGGNDRVSGGGGDDRINCGGGRDRVSGGAGNDKISGGSGNDKLSGGSGKDTLSGGSGSDRLLGGSGNDTLRGNGGRDRLYGNAGADRLVRDSLDRLFGGSGENRIIG